MESGDKRAAIVGAMLEVVAEYGFHAAPMSLVAERAGVGAGTIYRYFEDKDAVITACYQDLEGRFHEVILRDYPEGKPVRERFLHFATAVIRHLVSAPKDLRFLQQFHNSPFGADVRREKMFGRGGRNLIRDLFEEGRAQQITKDLPLPVSFALSMGPLINVCRDHALGFLNLDDELIAATVEACWDAIRR
jgi:AcrR family transcriptional regulator